MNCVEYESVESREFAIEKKGGAQSSKPLAERSRRARPGAHVARRVADVLEAQLARGSMPA
jgi:hypothetical protein